MVPYKYHFTVNDSKGIKVANAQLGLPQKTPDDATLIRSCEAQCRYLYTEGSPDYNNCINECQDQSGDTFEDALNNREYKHIVMLYCVPYEDPYKEALNGLLTDDHSSYTFETHGIKLTTYKTKGLMIDGVKLEGDDDFKPQFVFPNEEIISTTPGDAKFNLTEKYNFLRDGWSMVIMAEKTVKVKWYQRGIFKILMVIVVVVIAVMTANPTMLITYFGMQIAARILPPKALAILSIVAAVYTLGTSLSTNVSMMSQFVQVVKLADSLTQFYFMTATEDIQSEIGEYKEKTDKARDEIDELTNNGFNVWLGLDSVSNYYDDIYDIIYKVYDTAYDYDHYFDLNMGVLPK
jgi:hypothetical protein